jgi:hypothetical protein
MLKHSLTLIVSSAVLAVSAINPALAVPQDFVGTWVNTNPNTRAITHFVVKSTSPNNLTIQVFGKCSPTDCDWGQTTLLTYGSNVQDSDHKLATANYHPSFSRTLLTFNLNGPNRREILLQSFTQFLDNSGRQNYALQERFRRS